jgi:hypothetical protein
MVLLNYAVGLDKIEGLFGTKESKIEERNKKHRK